MPVTQRPRALVLAVHHPPAPVMSVALVVDHQS
jgi:hypothetical protein